MSSEIFSIHEAAHAVIAISLSQPFRRVFLGIGSSGSGEFLQGGVEGFSSQSEKPDDMRIISLSGSVAQVHYEWPGLILANQQLKNKPELNKNETIKERFRRNDKDVKAYEIYGGFQEKETLVEDIILTIPLIEEHWPKIILVANKLRETASLTMHEVEAILS